MSTPFRYPTDEDRDDLDSLNLDFKPCPLVSSGSVASVWAATGSEGR